jgi:aminopeptidase N
MLHIMKSLRLLLAMIATAIACAPRPSVSDGAPLPSVPAVDLSPFVLSAAEIAQAQRVPPFAAQPLVTWGAAPRGSARAERPRTFDLRHQDTRLRVDWARHALVGTTTLTIAGLNAPLQTVTLDAVNMTISGVTNAQGAPLRHAYDKRALTITLPNTLEPGATATVTVNYETVRPQKGFYFVDRARAFWTQGETEDTRYWVPTYDYPNDKTTWEFRLIVPRGQKALSNGRLVGTRETAEGSEWHWTLEHPASTYLMSAAGGTYEMLRDKHGAIPVNYWTYPDSVDAAWRGFGKTPRMMEIFEARTGVRYPWTKYDQIVAPDFIFGGMENVTATTQNDNSILWPRSAEPHQSSDGLVSHELAHQWFGNSLTMRDWSHIWLNEGFATFMETIYYEGAGEAERAAISRRDDVNGAITADRRARRPLVYDRWEQDPIELFFTGHIYPKGASVLNMLRRQLGDSLFWRGINDYTTRNSFATVVSEDLRASLERMSGRNLADFFRKWVYGAGFPAFRVSYTYSGATRRLTLDAQEIQSRDSLTGFFDPDVEVEVLTDAGPVRGMVAVRNGRGTLTLDVASPRAIIWDKGNWLIDIADFPRPTAMIAHQLLRSDDVSARSDAADDLAARAPERYALAALARAARSDSYWGVRARAINFLRAFPPDSIVRGILLEASADPDARVRDAAARGLSRYTGAAVTERLRVLATTDSALFVRAVALASYATVGREAALPLVRELIATPSWRDRLREPLLAALNELDLPDAKSLAAQYTRREP